MAVIARPHSATKAPPCHCSPTPHQPCPHTQKQVAAKKAATAKAAATRKKQLGEAMQLLKAHPPSATQVAALVTAAKAASTIRAVKAKKTRAANAKKNGPKTVVPPTAAVVAKRHKVAVQAAKTRAAHKGQPKKTTGLPAAVIANALATVRKADQAAYDKKHHVKHLTPAQVKKRAAAKKAAAIKKNPHQQLAVKAKKAKC